MANIFTGLDGAHRGVTDLYERNEKALRDALASGEAFDTGWYGVKHEIHTARIYRPEANGPFFLYTSAGMDDGPELVDTALWKAYGGNETCSCGDDALDKLGVVDEDQRTAMINEIADACGVNSDENYEREEKEVPSTHGYDELVDELDTMIDACDARLAVTFASVVEHCKGVIERLKGERDGKV